MSAIGRKRTDGTQEIGSLAGKTSMLKYLLRGHGTYKCYVLRREPDMQLENSQKTGER